MAKIVIGGKYGRDIVFVGNTYKMSAPVAKVIRDYFGHWNTLRDITRFPSLLEDLGDARAHRFFQDTDWAALDSFYKEHMQRYALVFAGKVEDGQGRFLVGCPAGAPAKPLAALLAEYCEAKGVLRDNFDLWRLDKLLRRGKAQLKYTAGFTEALKLFGARAVSLEESLSFYRQVQAYHAQQFLLPELAEQLAPYLDRMQTLRDPLATAELSGKLREAGAELRVHASVAPVVEHYRELAATQASFLGNSPPQFPERATPVAHKGYYSRGYLPHFDTPGAVQSITFRLGDSLPGYRVQQLSEQAKHDPTLVAKVAELLDAGHGACWLANPQVAETVQDALLFFNDERYRLLSWVVMPNHVHALIEALPGMQLAQIVRSWKNFSAREANKVLGRTGQFWGPDYFDRAVRDEHDYYDVIRYINNNPVKAGLAKAAEEYKWGSASRELRAATQAEENQDAELEFRAPGSAERPLPKPAHSFDQNSAPLLESLTNSPLYPFQREGVAFLTVNGRALLADDMGLGKTIQAIAAAVYLKQTRGVQRALVICPASLKYQWQAEIQRFSSERCEVIGGEPAERQAIYRAAASSGGFIAPEDKPFFYIVNYELVHRDLEQLKALAPELLILDEAQRVKNFRTKTAKAVFELNSPLCFVLTGTPLENQLMELFTIMRFIDDRALGKNPIAFRERYVVQDAFGGVLRYQRVDEVARKIASLTLRRTKDQALPGLPELVEMPRWLELTPAQRTIYQELQGQARTMLDDAAWDSVQSTNALTLLQRLRETCDSAELIDPELRDSAKVEELLSVLEDEVKTLGRQALVFTQWTRMGEILVRELSAAGMAPAFLHGGIPAAQRPAMIERFMAGRVPILVSTDAGGVGLNLQAASLVVNYDLPFNPARLAQRISRAHRLGQTGSVVVVNLLSRATVEEKMVRILKEKQELFQDVFGDLSDPTGAQAKAEQLSMRELLRLAL